MSPSQSELEALERCEELWFADGSVVLRAEGRLFRVYSGLLGSYSSVFADMFSVPQPEKSENVFGCSFVHLPDRASDVYHLLKLIHDASYHDKIGMGVNVAASVLRICTKYDIPIFRRRALQRLELAYPSTLEAWDKMTDEVRSDAAKYSILAIHTALECDVDSMLPPAFYLLISLGLEAILDGITTDDGMHHILEPQRQRNVLLARRDLAMAHAERILRPFMSDHWGCPDRCRARRHTIISQRLPEQPSNLNYDPLKPIENGMSELCRSCNPGEDELKRTREYIWQDLPYILGIKERLVELAEERVVEPAEIAGSGD